MVASGGAGAHVILAAREGLDEPGQAGPRAEHHADHSDGDRNGDVKACGEALHSQARAFWDGVGGRARRLVHKNDASTGQKSGRTVLGAR
jgi:hypothetical protein